MPTSRFAPPFRPLSLLLATLSLSLGSSLHAQSVFVKLGAKNKAPATVTIPAPGFGWEYSAAAPIPGTIWNQIARTAGIDITDQTVLAKAGKPGAGKLGSYTITPQGGIPLVSPAGIETPARLSIAVDVRKLATDKSRVEPTIATGSKAVPAGLVDSAWRVYLRENGLTFIVEGLKPAHDYDLYVYAGRSDYGTSSANDNDQSGVRLDLLPAYAASGQGLIKELRGGYLGNLYTYDPDQNRIALSPEGSTWGSLVLRSDSNGTIVFATGANNGRNHYLNGFQLVDRKP